MAAATTGSINGSGGHDGDALLSLLMRGAGTNEGLLDLGGSSSSSSSSYLHSLTSKSLADLRVQPAALTTTITSLDGQLSTLCARHVDSFVQVRQASSSLPRGLDALDAKLDSLLDHAIPRLAQASQRFPSAAQPHLEAKRRAQALLKQHRASLADVLELPALLATCVRANHPVEALQLGIHIARLSRPADSFATTASSSQSIPFPGEAARGHAVLVALRREAWQHLVVLRDDLLKGLDARGLRLPVARRYVSLLRMFSEVDHEAAGGSLRGQSVHDKQIRGSPPKLALSDSTICLSLLRSRYAALVSRLENATSSHEEASDAASRCSARISVWREAVNDAIGMALALFVDRPAQPASSSTTTVVDSNAETGDDAAEEADSELSPTMLISAFASKALHLLGASLDADVPEITSSAFERHPASYSKAATDVLSTFASLHTQLSYASVSLARLGLDFSVSLSSPSSSSSSTAGTCGAFEREVLHVWTRGLRRATDVFSQRWASSADVASLLASPSAATVPKMLRPDTTSSSTTTTDAAAAPSRALLDVPALATLLNHLLEAYNALQTFCPAVIGQEIGEVLDETLDQTLELALGLASRLDMAEAVADGGPSTADSIAALLPALDVQLEDLGQGTGEGEREDVASTSRDPQRLKEAQHMLVATVLSLLERDVVGFVRPRVVRLVSGDADGDVGGSEERAGLTEKRRAVVAWAARAREAWKEGEEKRRDALRNRLEARRAESERERLKREEEERARRAKEEEETMAREEREEKLRKEEEERARRAKEEEARLERERLEKERLEKERLEKERLEKERLEKERLEKERLEKERFEKERLEKERVENERLEKERLEKERLEKERLEKERLERMEREQEEKRKKEQERLKREEEERWKREEEERLKREEERLKREEEAKLRRQREEEEKLKNEEEERRVREEEKLAAKKRKEEEERRVKEEEQERKRAAEEKAAKEEAQRKKEEEEEAKRQAEAEEEAKAKAKEEMAKTEQEKDAAAGSEETKEEMPAAASAPKKAGSMSLAEKLRKAREERERAAAAAAAVATPTPADADAKKAPANDKATGEPEGKAEPAPSTEEEGSKQGGQDTPVSKGSQSSGEGDGDGDEDGDDGEGEADGRPSSTAADGAAAAKKKAKKKRQKKNKAAAAATQ